MLAPMTPPNNLKNISSKIEAEEVYCSPLAEDLTGRELPSDSSTCFST